MNFTLSEKGLNEVIGQNLAQLRWCQRITQSRAAKQLDVSLSQIKKYEQGKDSIRLDTAVRACVVYGSSMQRLFCGTPYGDNASSCPVQALLDKYSCDIASLPSEHYNIFIKSLNILLGNISHKAQKIETPHNKKNKFKFTRKNIEQYYQAIGRGVISYRKKSGISLDQFSERVDISPSSLKDYESRGVVRRFSLVLAGRFTLATRQNPLELVKNTEIGRVRLHRDHRIQSFGELLYSMPDEDLDRLDHTIKGLLALVEYNRLPKQPG